MTTARLQRGVGNNMARRPRPRTVQRSAPIGDGRTAAPATWPVSWWQQGYKLPAVQGSAVVEACVAAIAQTVAQLPINHWRDQANGGRERVTTSAAARVMRRPN